MADDRKHRLVSNSALNFAGQSVVLAITIASSPYIVRKLGAEQFGIIAMVQAVAGFAGLLNLGLGRALTKYISELYWQEKFEEINRIFQTAWTVCFVIGSLSFIAISVPHDLSARLLFGSDPTARPFATFAVLVAAGGLFTSLVLESLGGIPSAVQHFRIQNVISVSSFVLKIGSTILVLHLGFSVRAVLAVNLLFNVLTIIAYAAIARRYLPTLRFRFLLDPPSLHKLFSFSIPLLISTVSTLIVTRLDRFIMVDYLPLAAVTFYTLPNSLAEKLTFGVGSVASAVFPFASELHSQGNRHAVQELYLKGSRMVNIATLPLLALLTVVPYQILSCWLGKEYADSGAQVLALLGFASYLNAITAVPTVVTLGTGNAWLPAYYALAGSVANIALNLTLIPRFGIIGAAMAILGSQIVSAPTFLVHTARRLNVSIVGLVKGAFLGPILCAGTMAVALYVCRDSLSSTRNLIVVVALLLLFYAVVVLFFLFTQSERSALLAKVRQAVPVFGSVR